MIATSKVKSLFLARRACNQSLPKQCTSYTRLLSTNSAIFKVSEEVDDAIRTGKPVVALETTIYTHGFPYPDNIALSSLLESTVRANGGIPATIGVLNGVARVGMSAEEIIELLESAGRATTIKLSRRDLGYTCGLGINGRRLNGGTTIAGTLALAHLAGIKVFATGGLGGVHKGGESSMDISADLTELGRTPVALISSGCKSFLDTPRTLEFLETHGVGVGTFADGRDGAVDFPAFWTRDGGVKSPTTIKDEKDAAAMIYAQLAMPLESGLLFANPIAEEHSLSKTTMDEVMAQAVQEAEDQGVSGNNNTPFVLSRIRELTNGSTVKANRALVEGNVRRGTKVAVELAKLQLRDQGILDRIPVQSHRDGDTSQSLIGREEIDVFVAGSLAVDVSCNYDPINQPGTSPSLRTSNPAAISQSVGGVGRNVALAAHYAGANVRFCTAVGHDEAGRAATQSVQDQGLDTSSINTLGAGARTAQYVAVNDVGGDLVIAMADMKIFDNNEDGFDERWECHLNRYKPQWLVVDGNWDSQTLRKWIHAGKSVGANIAYEPVSVEKSSRIFLPIEEMHSDKDIKQPLSGPSRTAAWNPMQLADLAAPNEIELHAMSQYVQASNAVSPSFKSEVSQCSLLKSLDQRKEGSLQSIDVHIILAALNLIFYIPCILTKLGSKGVLLAEHLRIGDSRLSDSAEAKYILPNIWGHMDEPLDAPSMPLGRPPSPSIYLRHFPPAQTIPTRDIVSVNGVGDTFFGVLIAGLCRRKSCSIGELVDVAQKAATMTLRSPESVSANIRAIWD